MSSTDRRRRGNRLNATTGAALLGTDAQLLHQDYRRVLAQVAGEAPRGAGPAAFASPEAGGVSGAATQAHEHQQQLAAQAWAVGPPHALHTRYRQPVFRGTRIPA